MALACSLSTTIHPSKLVILLLGDLRVVFLVQLVVALVRLVVFLVLPFAAPDLLVVALALLL